MIEPGMQTSASENALCCEGAGRGNGVAQVVSHRRPLLYGVPRYIVSADNVAPAKGPQDAIGTFKHGVGPGRIFTSTVVAKSHTTEQQVESGHKVAGNPRMLSLGAEKL